jgi:hypothetical protein
MKNNIKKKDITSNEKIILKLKINKLKTVNKREIIVLVKKELGNKIKLVRNLSKKRLQFEVEK